MGSSRLALRGLQLLGAALLFYLLGRAFGSAGNHTVGAIEVLLAPLTSAVVVANGCGPRPWIFRAHWRPSSLLLRVATLVGLVFFVVDASTAILAPPLLNGDQFATSLCAAQDLLRGHDPYQTGEPQCLASLGITNDANLTPLRTAPFDPQHYPSLAQQGAAEAADLAHHTSSGFPYLGYPPLSFLSILPVAAFGFAAVNVWIIALVLLTLVAVARRAGRAGGIVTAVVAVGLGWCLSSFGGDPEILAYCALILAVAYLDRPLLSGVLLAVACCINELAWLAVIPYLTVWVRLPEFRRRLTALLAVSVGVIALWTLYDHRFPAEELRFLTQPLYPIGAGLNYLVPMTHFPSLLFNGGFAGLYLVGIAIAWRRPDWSWGMLAISWVLLWVAWRSLLYYYLPLVWLGPVVALALEREHQRVSAGSSIQVVSSDPPLARRWGWLAAFPPSMRRVLARGPALKARSSP